MPEDIQGEKIEFNSMVDILRRLSKTTYELNDARAAKDYSVMVDRLVDYYKEISPDLTEKEKDIWKKLKVLKRFTYPLLKEKMPWVLMKADELDIELRCLAKKHGYLTKNIKDLKKAIVMD